MVRLMLTLALSGAGVFAGAITQTPFLGRTDLVPIYATVSDAEGRLVTDLTPEEFEVHDNGRRQEIALFSRSPQPITAVVMLDRSGSVMSQLEVVQHAAERFLENLFPDDRVRIGAFAQHIRMLPTDFTSDRRELIQILREGLEEDVLGPSPVWTAIDHAIGALKRASTRRVVLIFSDGHDDPGVEQVRTRFEDLVQRVVANNVMVYAIAVRGSPSPRSSGQLGSRKFASGVSSKRPDPRLRRIADASGGGYFELDRAQNLDAAFRRTAQELHNQYLIAFKPALLDGKAHEVEVKVRRRGTSVRARKNYIAVPWNQQREEVTSSRSRGAGSENSDTKSSGNSGTTGRGRRR